MKPLIINLLECTIAMSVISLIYMTVMPLLTRRYSAKWLYYCWLVIVIGWLFPFRPQLNINLFSVNMPVIQNITAIQTIPLDYIRTANPLAIVADETNTSSFSSLWWIFTSVWITGFFISIFYNASRHWRFMKLVNRWGENITDLQILNVLNELRAEMGISMKVGIKTCPSITNPMVAGFFKPVIFLPSAEINSNELTFILKHELGHLKRNDLWFKAIVLLTTAIHWFNPVVYIMARTIAVQCEISCDELILQGTCFEKRRQYGETIIAFVRNEAKLQTALSTNFYGGNKDMKTRIFSIMDTSKKRTGIIILSTVILATITSGMVFVTDSTKNDTSGDLNIVRQTEIPSIGPTEIKVLDIPEITKIELSESELSQPELPVTELAEPELSGPKLPGPELPGPELPGPELTKSERVVKYNQDDIEILSVVNDTEYIDIDWLNRYLINKYDSDYSIYFIEDQTGFTKAQLYSGKSNSVLYDNIPTYTFLFNDDQRNCIKYDVFINMLLPLMTD